MSEKNIRIRLDGRGNLADVHKDMDADCVVAYVMTFGDEESETNIVVFGGHDIRNKEFARQLGNSTASMLTTAFECEENEETLWREFDSAYREQMSKAAIKRVKKLIDMLKDSGLLDDEEEEGEV